MPDNKPPPETTPDAIAELRARADTLERQLADAKLESQARLIRAELKVEAVRAGMVDLDGLKLLNLADTKLNGDGEVEDAPQIMAELRRAKPWLFGGTSSSSPAIAPPVQPHRQKLATDMTDEEYRAARVALLKQYG